MNLLETYSHFCGVKPLEPFIWEDYFPIPFDKYIVIQGGAGMPSKQYDYWEYVLENIKLKKVQIGGKDDFRLPVDLNLCGSTTWNQSACIINGASLFLGTDSIGNHLASALGKPRIALFGPTSPLTCGGVFDRSKAIELTPVDMRGCLSPCHHAQCLRGEKCINSIAPEIVINKVAELLGEEAVRRVKILHVGKLVKTPYIEWIPKSCGQEEFDVLRRFVGAVNVKVEGECDLKDLSIICNSCNLKYIFIMSPSDIDSFEVSPLKVEQVFVRVDKANIAKGIDVMKRLNAKMYKTRLISALPTGEFNCCKLDMLDFPPIEKLDESYPLQLEKLCGSCYVIQTARKILAQDGKFFLTLFDARRNQNSVRLEDNSLSIKLDKEHLKEASYFAIKDCGNQ